MHGLLSLSYSALAAFCVLASIGKTFAAPNPQPRDATDLLNTAALPPSSNGDYPADYTDYDAYFIISTWDVTNVMQNLFETFIYTGSSSANATKYFPDDGTIGAAITANDTQMVFSIITKPYAPYTGYRQWFSEAFTNDNTAATLAANVQQSMESLDSIELCLELVYDQIPWGIALIQGGWNGMAYEDTPDGLKARLAACLSTFGLN